MRFETLIADLSFLGSNISWAAWH